MPMNVEWLTAERFAPFGDVIEVNDAVHHYTINQGYTERYHDLAAVDVLNYNGRVALNIFRSTPLPRPIQIRLLERHPMSSQAFMPLGQAPYLVVVAPAGELQPANIRAFIASPNQGVNYHAGTWHHFCLALDTTSDFLVVDRVGSGPNCDEQTLDTPLMIDASTIDHLVNTRRSSES